MSVGDKSKTNNCSHWPFDFIGVVSCRILQQLLYDSLFRDDSRYSLFPAFPDQFNLSMDCEVNEREQVAWS